MDLDEGIDFTVSWPPSLNNYYARTRYGVHIKKKGKEYRELIAQDLQEQVGVLTCIDEPVFVSAILYPPTNRVWDLDNHMKALQDALTVNGFWDDDNLVAQLLLYKGEVIKGGKVKLHIGSAMPVVGDGWSPADLL
jgi:crossover junction endodeoxyribonuclease RusA